MATFGGYVNGAQVVSAAAKTEITTNINRLAALIPLQQNQIAAGTPGAITGTTTKPPSPDFDLIHPALASQLRTEFAALITAINAAPIA